jgi:hypothetical protein
MPGRRRSQHGDPILRRDVVVIGASAGGVEALQRLVAGLPPDLPAAILVVVHIPSYCESELDRVLSRAGPLRAQRAIDGEPLAPGRIYVARADHHMMVRGNLIRLTRAPKESRVRPSIDVLFRSAAQSLGPRVIGVLLTGTLDDGSAGLWAVKDQGGLAIVQSPADCAFPSMPQSALAQVQVDHAVPMVSMPALLARLVSEPAPAITRPIAPPPKALRTSAVAARSTGLRTAPSIPAPSSRDRPKTLGGRCWELKSARPCSRKHPRATGPMRQLQLFEDEAPPPPPVESVVGPREAPHWFGIGIREPEGHSEARTAPSPRSDDVRAPFLAQRR